MINLTVDKNLYEKGGGYAVNLYSGTFKRFATQSSSKTQRSPQMASHVPHKI